MHIEDVLKKNTLYSFYGVCNNEFKLGNLIFEAFEDVNDGWRSYLGSIQVVKSDSIFITKPLVNVYFKKSASDAIDKLYFEDETGHVWLTIGTDYNDCWYPHFVFSYTPREDVQEFAEELGNLDNLV